MASYSLYVGRGRQQRQQLTSTLSGRDRVSLPAPDWALEPSTWTQIEGSGETFFIEADEERAVEIFHEQTGVNPLAPGYYDAAAGEVIERRDCSLAKASHFTRNAKLVADQGENWDQAHLDETKPASTLFGRSEEISSVKRMLDFGLVKVIRAPEATTIQVKVDHEELNLEANLAWEDVQHLGEET